jgi:hypothetical protein
VIPLLIGMSILIPEQSSTMLGVELVATGLLGGGLLLRLNRPSKRAEQETWGVWLLGSYVPSLVVALLTVVGGIALIADRGGGLYWVAPAVVIALLTGLARAWVNACGDPSLISSGPPRNLNTVPPHSNPAASH